MCWSLSFTREWLVTGMPSSMLRVKSNVMKQNSPRIVVYIDGTRGFRPAVECDRLVEGELKLYFSVWEPPIMYLAWNILRSLSFYVDNESIPTKILIYLCLKAQALAPLKSMHPSAKGLSILLFY